MRCLTVNYQRLKSLACNSLVLQAHAARGGFTGYNRLVDIGLQTLAGFSLAVRCGSPDMERELMHDTSLRVTTVN